MPSRSVHDWLPALEAARRAVPELSVDRGWFRRGTNLWQVDPEATERRCGVVLRGHAVHRTRWVREDELSARALARLRAAVPPDPATLTESRSYQRLLTDEPEEGRCTGCPIRPGLGPCGRCSGTGVIEVRGGGRNSDPREVPCSECQGGFARCTICEGSARTFRARVESVEDRVQPFVLLALPDDVPAPLAAWLTEQVQNVWDAPPDALALPLEQPLDAGPYRDARAEEFYGHPLGRAREAARRMLAAHVGEGDAAHHAYKSWALPLLWLRFAHDARRYDVAIVVAPDGDTQVHLAAAP